jgi:hypothetical protein
MRGAEVIGIGRQHGATQPLGFVEPPGAMVRHRQIEGLRCSRLAHRFSRSKSLESRAHYIGIPRASMRAPAESDGIVKTRQ